MKIRIIRSGTVAAELAALARIERPVVLAAVIAGTGLAYALLCTLGAP